MIVLLVPSMMELMIYALLALFNVPLVLPHLLIVKYVEVIE